MNLHEYQAKQLFASYGIPVPRNQVIDKAQQAPEAVKKLGGARWVVKAQVHAGGRGKAGGVKLTDRPAEVEKLAAGMLGRRLVTYQTGADGQPVNQVLIEETCNIARELYLGAVIDRGSQRIVFMASTEGGVEIEKVAAETPEKILKIKVEPLTGVMPANSSASSATY
jgi:succinyl-CoA synthetase beta subunit